MQEKLIVNPSCLWLKVDINLGVSHRSWRPYWSQQSSSFGAHTCTLSKCRFCVMIARRVLHAVPAVSGGWFFHVMKQAGGRLDA